MARGFTVFALWLALLAVGYERFSKVGQAELQQPVTQEEKYGIAEGGDGLPPPPPPCCG